MGRAWIKGYENDYVEFEDLKIIDANDNTKYVYYEKDGTYLGGNENSKKIYFTNKKDYEDVKKNKNWNSINIASNAVKLFSNYISNKDLLEFGGIINGEATNVASLSVGISKEELIQERCALANVIYNYLKKSSSKEKVQDIPLNFAYARKDETISYKKIINSSIEERNDEWVKIAIGAAFNAITEKKDYSNGATQWDGGDVFTGNKNKNKDKNYNPMYHYRQKPFSYDKRLKGIYDKHNLAKKMYYNLIEYYKIVDTHRKTHLKPLRTSQKSSNWEILFFEEKSYNLYVEGKLKFDEIKLLDEYEKKPEYDTDKVPMFSSGSTRTWVFAGLMCLWEVTAQYGCTIFYKQIKKYNKSKINPNDAPFY